MLTLSLVLICYYFVYSFFFVKVTVSNLPSNPSAERGLYTYDLDGLRLLFAAENSLAIEVPQMKLIHQNDFWDPVRCAGMIPSIYYDKSFFVDRKIEVLDDGTLVKLGLIYQFDFITQKLTEISAPILAERIYRRDGLFFVARGARGLVFLYEISSGHEYLRLRDFFILPPKYSLITSTRYLAWCDASNTCITNEKYIAFERSSADLVRTQDEQKHTYKHGDRDLVLEKNTKNLFLGY